MITIDGLTFVLIQCALVAIGAIGAIVLLILRKVNPKEKVDAEVHKKWKNWLAVALGCVVVGELLLWLV